MRSRYRLHRIPGSARPRWPFALNRDCSLLDGMVACWPFWSLVGDQYDLIKGYVATPSGLNAPSASPHLGCATPDFGGTTGNITCNNAELDNIHTFTWSAWVMAHTQGGQSDARIIHKGSTSTRKQLQIDSSTTWGVTLYVNRTGADATAKSVNNALVANTWTHVVGTYSESAGPRVFLDGLEVSYASQATGSNSTAADTGSGVVIGNRGDGNKGWDGQITDVRMWSRILLDEEIWQMYDPNTRWALYAPWSPRVWSFGAAAGTFPVSQSVGALWEALTPATQTTAPLWEALSLLVPTKSSLYESLTPMSQTKAGLWESLTLASQSKSGLWESGGLVAPSRVALWEALGLLVPTKSPLYESLTPMNQTKAGLWESLTPVSQSKAARYESLTPATQSKAALWEALGFLSSARVALWESLGAMSQGKAALWEALRFLSSDRVALWESTAPAGSVSHALVVLWESLGVPLSSRVALWESTAPLSQSKAGLYEAVAPVSQSKSGLWEALGLVAPSRVVLWEALGALSNSRVALWASVAPLTQSKTGLYESLAPVSQSKSGVWESLGAVSQSKGGLWESLTIASQSKAALWESLGLGSVTKSQAVLFESLASVAQNRASLWASTAVLTQGQAGLWEAVVPLSVARVALAEALAPVNRARDGLWESLALASQARGALWESLSIYSAVARSIVVLWESRSGLIIYAPYPALWRVRSRLMVAPRTVRERMVLAVHRLRPFILVALRRVRKLEEDMFAEPSLVEAGNQVNIEWETRDGLKDSTPLTDPNQWVRITIYDPSGVAVIADQDMTKVTTGIYRYIHQTQTNHAKGTYTGTVTTSHGGGRNQKTEDLFTLVTK